MMISEKILSELERLHVNFCIDYELKNSCTFRVGGKCALALFPCDESCLALCVSLLDSYGVPLHIVGKGSNTLFFDGFIDKAFVFTSNVNQINVSDTLLSCGAGVGLVSLAAKACDMGLEGLEFACGIPGSIGGAVFMNAGAHGGAMENIVVSTRAYNRKQKRTVTITENMFGYRDSIYKNNSDLVCLGADILLSRGEPQQIRVKMRELLDQRKSKQPIEYPSAGSYFKRPEGDFAGRLIETCGLKGMKMGGAEVSQKHAGFIINKGNATFNDIIMLERIVIDSVYEKTGVLLQREVEIVE